MQKLFILILQLWVYNSLFCQQIDTDRSSVSNTPFTIGKKNIQFEMGFGKYVDKDDTKPYRDILKIYPNLISKYGIGEQIEIHTGITWNNYKNIASNGTFKSSSIPFYLIGAKFNFNKQKQLLPATALLIQFQNYNRQIRRDGLDSSFNYLIKLLFQNKFNASFKLNYAIGVEHQYYDLNPTPRILFSLNPIVNFNEQWQGYIDIHGFTNFKARSPKLFLYSGMGINFYINEKIKFDANFGIKLNKAHMEYNQTDNYYNIGFSYKINNTTNGSY